MRPGLSQAATANTRLWLRFRESPSLLTDDGPDGLTLTRSGSVVWAPGPYDHGAEFATTGTLTCSMASFAGSITGDLWVRATEASSRHMVRWLSTGGGTLDVFSFAVSLTSATLTAYNPAGTAFPLSPEVSWPSVARWTHFRFVIQPGTALSIYRDGALVAYTTAAPATIPTSSLPVLTIGGGTHSTAWQMGEIMLRAEADTDPATCSPLLGRHRATRRRTRVHEYDLKELIQDYSYTATGSGGLLYYRALSGFALGGFMLDPHDVISVKATTAGVTTTYTQEGNATDVDSGSNKYFFDHVNRRLYVSEDPAAIDTLAVAVRWRIADHGYERGGRFYRGLVLSAGAGTREQPWWNEAYPTGGGGTVQIAAHADLPAFLYEETSNVAWLDAAVRIASLTDSMPWSERTAEFWGLCEAQPSDDHDTFSLTIAHEPARLYRAPLARRRANLEDWPNLQPSANGYVWPLITGAGHRVKLINVDTAGTTVDLVGYGEVIMWRWKWADHPCARVVNFGVGNQVAQVYYANLDLDLSEVMLTFSGLTPGAPRDIWATVDGLGDAASPTSPTDTLQTTVPFGDLADCYLSLEDILQQVLIRFFGYTASSFGATWAATAARVQRYLRGAEQLDSPDSAVAWFRARLRDSLTFLYWRPDTETIEWEDIRKADASDWTLTDANVLTERWETYRANMAQRINARATSYALDPATGALVDEESTLATLTDERYRVPEVLDLGRSGVYNVATLDVLLADVRDLGTERPLHRDTVVGTDALRGIEQHDVVTVATSRLPAGAGARFRVMRVMPAAVGRSIHLAPEAPFPADGTSATSSRSPRAPIVNSHCGGPETETTTGSWIPIGDNLTAYQGDLVAFHSDVAHRLQARAVRVGGAADSDVLIRLAEVDAAGAHVATLGTFSGVPTSDAFLTAVTSLSNIPAALALLQWQINLAAGVTSATVKDASWWTRETGGPDVTTPPPATHTWQAGCAPGAVCSGTSGIVPNIAVGARNGPWGWPSGATGRWAIRANGSGTTFHLYAYAVTRWSNSTTPTLGALIADFGVITTDGWTTLEAPLPNAFGVAQFVFYYTQASGSSTVYAASFLIQNRPGR